MMTIRADGHGEIAFGAMQASLDLEYSHSMVFFTWAGFEEMDDVNGSGSAELLDKGSIEIQFAYHLGDQAFLKAKPAISSTGCYAINLIPAMKGRTVIRPYGPRTMSRALVDRPLQVKVEFRDTTPNSRMHDSDVTRSSVMPSEKVTGMLAPRHNCKHGDTATDTDSWINHESEPCPIALMLLDARQKTQ